MDITNASEFVKTHIRWEKEPSEGVSEHTLAVEAVAALFAVADGWLDIVALELRFGFFDHGTLTEAEISPPDPHHLLRTESARNARVHPAYHSLESRLSAVDAETVTAWVERKLADLRTDDARYEPALQELHVVGVRARLPEPGARERLRVSCYAGEIEVPIDDGWVATPMSPDGVPDPVTLGITNTDGSLRLVLDVFWSAWGDAPERPQAIRDGLARLEARGWRMDA